MPSTAVAPDAPATTALSERAMNVSLNLKMWHARRNDRKTTGEVLEERKAEKDAGRFEKHLVPPKSLEKVRKAHTAARAQHYDLTLPWGDEGVRILAATAFFDYSTAMNECRTDCERAHEEFIAEYPRLMELAPVRLGEKLYVATDYPDPRTIHEKFGFNLSVMPVADATDFRVTLGEETEQRIRADIEATLGQRYGDAQRDLYGRLLDTVRHFANTMAQGDKIFRDTTVTKLADLARIAPKLSLQPDPRLDEMCAEVLKITEGVAPNDFRESDALRARAAVQARQAVANIQNMLDGAF